MNLAVPAARRSRPARPGGCNMLLCSSASARLAAVPSPLDADELLGLLQGRWQASYDLQLVQRRGRLYLQVMWAYLEQQSFPLSAAEYRERITAIAAAINDLGLAQEVRQWLATTQDRPRLGKALSLPLEPPQGRASEFLL
jgi:hypothetical protein